MRIGLRHLRAVSVLLFAFALVPAGALVRTGRADAAVAPAAGFEAGAAQVDITPPAWTAASDQAFVPVCGRSAAQVGRQWTGKRLFAFEKPYIDLFGKGEYVPGDPYCDADGAHRYEAPYLAGGSGQNRWPTSVDGATSTLGPDPIEAQAVVLASGGHRVALVTVDSIGLFDTTMDAIRANVEASDRDLAPQDILVSSTHDESAPDPIGLWGPDTSDAPGHLATPAAVSSGVDEYYMRWMAARVAGAVVAADRSLQPARLVLAQAAQPPDTQTCWSSYPFVDAQLTPVMQGVATASGKAIFTLVDPNTHDESLAFSGVPAYTSMLSGDWAGRMRAALEARYGGVAIEMAGLVGSVEMPTVYPGAQVVDVPGALQAVPGNPDGCSSVYPTPAGAAPVTDARLYTGAYGASVAAATEAALGGPSAVGLTPGRIGVQTAPLCLQLQNNLFAAAFAAGLFPDRPAFADPNCTTGATLGGRPSTGSPAPGARTGPGAPTYLRSEVGVVSLGPVQIAYSPGEVFPFTEIGGPIDASQMPFPTDCYDPAANGTAAFYCGAMLPMTPYTSAQMTGPYRFMAGLGEDMIGYLFPPGNFVGSQGEVLGPPWSVYENTSSTGNDRFGYGHADDPESVGPDAGLAVGDALAGLLGRDGPGTPVRPGLFTDAAGHLCDTPFPASSPDERGTPWERCSGFTGAVGVALAGTGGAAPTRITVDGTRVRWATYDATVDPGTAATAYPYSVDTRGILVDGKPLLLDVFAGAHDFHLPGN